MILIESVSCALLPLVFGSSKVKYVSCTVPHAKTAVMFAIAKAASVETATIMAAAAAAADCHSICSSSGRNRSNPATANVCQQPITVVCKQQNRTSCGNSSSNSNSRIDSGKVATVSIRAMAIALATTTLNYMQHSVL